MGEENQQEKNSHCSNTSEAVQDEEESDQGEVMYEDDVLEVIDDDTSPEEGSHCCLYVVSIFVTLTCAGLRAELDDLDMEDDDNEGETEGGGGGFVPLREDAVQCFKEHAGKVKIIVNSIPIHLYARM